MQTCQLCKEKKNKVYYCKNGLTVGDSSSEIFEKFKLKDSDWIFDISYSYDFIDENYSSEWDSVEKELIGKVNTIKSKKEYTDLRTAKELIEKESTLLDDNRLCINLTLKAAISDDGFYLRNELLLPNGNEKDDRYEGIYILGISVQNGKVRTVWTEIFN